MDRMEQLGKNKNMILNSGIILLALFLAFQIYKSNNEKLNSLVMLKEGELKKNSATAEISVLEKKVDEYKTFFAKKDMSTVVAGISNIARDNSITIVSIKPIDDQVNTDYIRSSFAISVNAPNYHSLARFISQIEGAKDVYLVSEVKIDVGTDKENTLAEDTNLKVNLKVSTISYNE